MKIAIIGGGAAGCFAAANIAPVPGLEVTVFEKTGKVLQKVKASGGGRCNVTHNCFDVPDLLERYPRGRQLLRKTLYRFGPQDTIEWFRSRGVQLKAESDGRMFPVTDDSQTIIDAIWQAMMRNGVQVLYHRSVTAIVPENDAFRLQFADGTIYHADRVLVTSGGYPKIDQFGWLARLGHTIAAPVPSLFTFNLPGQEVTQLMGVAVPNATVKIEGTKITQSGPLLITHWGMSGPAVLKTSAWAARELAEKEYRFAILVNWLFDTTDNELKVTIADLRRDNGKQLVHNRNPFDLPRRLWEYLLQQCGIAEAQRWAELPAAAQNKLVEHLLRNRYTVQGKTTFKEEFVTSGGISLAEIDAQTMQSRIVKGLYFAGEVMDVDGVTGGFNFQHAWSSAFIAAHSMPA
jgi:hypothetical protein